MAQPLPELVPEEQDVHADHDGYQCEHVKHDGCLSSHRSFLLCATERSKSGAGFNEHLRGMSRRCFARRRSTPSMSCSEPDLSGFGNSVSNSKGHFMIASGLWAGALGGTRTPNLLIRKRYTYALLASMSSADRPGGCSAVQHLSAFGVLVSPKSGQDRSSPPLACRAGPE